jgi:hypothetical protein
LPPIKSLAERKILEENKVLVKVENVCELLQYALRYEATSLSKFCTEFAKKCAKAVIETEGFLNLPEQTKLEILDKNSLTKWQSRRQQVSVSIILCHRLALLYYYNVLDVLG